MNEKIVLLRPMLTEAQEAQVTALAERYGRRTVFCRTKEEALEEVRDAEIYYGAGTDVAAAAKELRWFCSGSAGVEQYVGEGVFASPDCLLTNSAGAYGVTISEHIIMLCILLARRMPEYFAITRDRNWKNGLMIRSIYGSRLLVLGTGDLGGTFAAHVRSLGPAEIIGVNRSGREAEGFDRTLAFTRLDEVLPEADFVIGCLPATAETENMLSAERIASMKETAFVVNVGRGSLIDEDALAEALNGGRLGGAALDVFRTEPLPKDHPLWTARNCIVTPHMAGQDALAQTIRKNLDMFCEDLENYCEGRPMAHLVDRRAGY